MPKISAKTERATLKVSILYANPDPVLIKKQETRTDSRRSRSICRQHSWMHQTCYFPSLTTTVAKGKNLTSHNKLFLIEMD